MIPPNKIRDSQKIVHFLRAELQAKVQPVPALKTGNTKKNLAIDPQQPKKVSPKHSSHFTDFTLKNQFGRYERCLLDVEDLEAVYEVIRDNLGVPRPYIPIEKKEPTVTEFEEKMLHDPEFRDATIIKQRRARVIRERKRAKSNPPKTSERQEVEGKEALNNTVIKESSEGGTKRLEEVDEAELELINGRKNVGKYSFETDRMVGKKISYKVYTFVEKPMKPKKRELKKVIQKENLVKLLGEEEEFEPEVIKMTKPEDDNPFLKVVIREHNPFKRKAHYVPLKEEDIDLEERMKKKWNSPSWTNFSSQKVRRSFKKPSIAVNDIINECETKLKSTKMNHPPRENNEKSFLDTFHNISIMSDLKNSVMDREYGISLKSSAIITPQVRLATLDEKVEERNRIFGKINEESKKVKPKNIKTNLEKIFETYQKMGPKALRSEHSGRQTLFSRPSTRLNKERSIKQETGTSFHKQKHPDQMSTTAREELLNDNKHKSIVEEDSSPPFEPRSTFMNTFLTQTNIVDKEQSEKDGSKEIRSENDPFNCSLRGVSFYASMKQKAKKAFKPILLLGGEQKDRKKKELNASYDFKNCSNTDRVETPKDQKTELNSPDRDRGIESVRPRTSASKRSEQSPFNSTGFSRYNVKPPSRPKRPSSAVPCSEIEDRLNKSFNEFINVKAKADMQFKAALNIIEKDRPLLNRIRHSTYDAKKIMFNHIDKLRGDAESFRLSRYRNNEGQRQLYLKLLRYIIDKELNETKLKACYYFMNIFKEMLERGETLSKESLNQLLNKFDDEKAINNVFLGVIAHVMEKLKLKTEEIENSFIRENLVKYIQNNSKRKESQGMIVTPKEEAVL